MTSYNIALAIAADLKKTHIADGRYDVLMFELVNEIARRNSSNNRVYTRPDKVWIDGALMYDAADPKRRPVSDFELGQPGEGDVK